MAAAAPPACTNAEAPGFINPALLDARTFHFGVGHRARGQPADVIETPQERAAAANRTLSDEQALTYGWTGTEEAEFVDLANSVIRGYWARNPRVRHQPFNVPDNRAFLSRSCSEFPDCPALGSLYNQEQTLAQKLQKLRDLNRTAIAAVQGQKARTSGSQAVAKREKRRKGAKSRASGQYGVDAKGFPKRSPHINLGKRSPPPLSSCLAEYTASQLRRGKPPPPPPSAGAGSASKASTRGQ